MTFRDRIDAGRRLAAELGRLAGQADVLVLALPRGGVPVAAEVARALGAPMDVFFAHKIGAPNNPEYAIGSVTEVGAPYIDEAAIQALRVPFSYIKEETAFQQRELAGRALRYRGGREAMGVAGKRVILVDDGWPRGRRRMRRWRRCVRNCRSGSSLRHRWRRRNLCSGWRRTRMSWRSCIRRGGSRR